MTPSHLHFIGSWFYSVDTIRHPPIRCSETVKSLILKTIR